MSDEQRGRGPRRAWLPVALVWLAAALVVGGYVGGTIAARREYLGRLAEVAADEQRARAKVAQLRGMRGATLDEVRRAFDGGVEVAPLRPGHSQVRLVTWPRAGCSIWLLFDGQGRFREVSSYVIDIPAPAYGRALARLERAHPHVTRYGGWAWLALLVSAVLLKGARRPALHAALAVAMGCFAASWFLSGNVFRLVGAGNFYVRLPYWAPQAAQVGISALILVLTLVLRPRDRGLTCPRCRYDLHGNESGVCPECGARIPASLRWRIRQAAAAAAAAGATTAAVATASTVEPAQVEALAAVADDADAEVNADDGAVLDEDAVPAEGGDDVDPPVAQG